MTDRGRMTGVGKKKNSGKKVAVIVQYTRLDGKMVLKKMPEQL